MFDLGANTSPTKTRFNEDLIGNKQAAAPDPVLLQDSLEATTAQTHTLTPAHTNFTAALCLSLPGIGACPSARATYRDEKGSE